MVINKYAEDEEYELPEYKAISQEMLKIFKETTKIDLKTLEGNKQYIDGQVFSRYWEYPWAIINSKVDKDMKVLDVGCGRAPFLFYLGSVIGCEAHGVDYDGHGSVEDGLWGCDEGRNEKYNFTVKKADVREILPYPDSTFDRVFCISTIEHMNDGEEAKRAAKEMVRVLKPNGLLVITVDQGIFQKEIEEAAGLPYLGECDFSRPKHKKPYSVLGTIFVKSGKDDVVTPEVMGLVAKADGYESVKEMEEAEKEEKEKDVQDIIQKEKEEISETSKGLLATIAGPDEKKDVPPKPKEGITFKEIGAKIMSKFKKK